MTVFMRKRGRVIARCRFCNKYFYTYECWLKRRPKGMLCSRECKDIEHGLNRLGFKHTIGTKNKIADSKNGAKNPAWMGGRSFIPYPMGWSDKLKEQIRYRDGYKCQVCSIEEVKYNRKLDIHHSDCDKTNLVADNLTTLCGKCHIKIHNKLRAETCKK